MPTSPIDEVLRHLRGALPARDAADLTDGQLLERFVSRREPTALAALVGRHGPMVWGVCRRTLGDVHDAEDAFQATFLVLVRRAASIRPRAKVGNWLYGVALTTARKARATRAKRRVRERSVTDMPEPAGTSRDPDRDLLRLLDQELCRLPEKYRAVIVLCELEGRTGNEAARQLGLPPGTVASRRARARALLAKRLARHGLPVAGGAVTGWLAPTAPAAVPAAVVAQTIQAAGRAAAGPAAAAGAVSVRAAALAEGVLKAMLITRLTTATAVLLAACTAALTCAAFAGQRQGTGSDGRPAPAASDRAPAPKKEPARDDLDWRAFDDPGAFFLTDPFARSVAALPGPARAAAVRRLHEALKSGVVEIHRRAALVLGKLGDTAGVPVMIADLRRAAGRDRDNVVVALRILGDRRAIPALRAALKDKSPYVRGIALAALGELKAHAAYAEIVAHTRDKERQGGKGLNCFPSEPAHLACYALGALGDRRAVPVLIELLNDRDLKNDARQALEALTRQKLGPDPDRWKAWWKQQQR